MQAGISGAAAEGADSIVVSGGYEDDEDYGDEIIYTGHGGNDPNTGRQVADQQLKQGNLALAFSRKEGLPVRVVRGANPKSPYAPAERVPVRRVVAASSSTGPRPGDRAIRVMAVSGQFEKSRTYLATIRRAEVAGPGSGPSSDDRPANRLGVPP